MTSLILSLTKRTFLSVSVAMLVGCYNHTPAPPPSAALKEPATPKVQVPMAGILNEEEQRLYPEFLDALKDAGYTTTEADSDFEADFRIYDGAFRVETRMNFSLKGESLAYATWKEKGPTKVFRNTPFVDKCFFNALRVFEGQIPKATAFSKGNRYPANNVNYPDPPPDWRTGWQ